nr:hypothetical protein [Alphaproteobacteria bacterium]
MTSKADSTDQQSQAEQQTGKQDAPASKVSKPDTPQVSETSFQKQLSAAQLPQETREFMKSRLIAANFGNIV